MSTSILTTADLCALYAPADWLFNGYHWCHNGRWSPVSLLLQARGYTIGFYGPVLDAVDHLVQSEQFAQDYTQAVADISRWLGYADSWAYMLALQQTPDDVRQRLEARRLETLCPPQP